MDEPEVTLTGPELAEWQCYQELKAQAVTDGLSATEQVVDSVIQRHAARIIDLATEALNRHAR